MVEIKYEYGYCRGSLEMAIAIENLKGVIDGELYQAYKEEPDLMTLRILNKDVEAFVKELAERIEARPLDAVSLINVEDEDHLLEHDAYYALYDRMLFEQLLYDVVRQYNRNKE